MELKENVIRKIEKLDDDQLLKELDAWLTDETGTEPKFTSKEVREVNEGYAEYLAGKTYSSTEAQQQFEKWMKEK